MRRAAPPLLRLLGALLLALCIAPAWAADDDATLDDTGYLELAARLTGDGEYERAARALAEVTVDAEDLDVAKYYTVAGLIALNQNRNEDAVRDLNSAIENGQVDPLIRLYLAQAHFALEQWPQTLKALEAGGETADGLASVWLMRSHAQWSMDDRQAALDTLSRAATRFPANTSFTRRQVFYLIELGLFREAADLGRQFLARADAKAEDYAAIGSALRRTRSYPEALRILEAAHLRYPDNGNVAKALSQTWLEAGNPLAAAVLLERIAWNERDLFAEAAELYRRAGYPAQALMLNARVPDQTRKLKQRVGILVQARRYAEVAGMEDALFRNQLLDDEDVRYAVAYANFRIGDFTATERHLSALRRPDLFRKATELRKVMEECADAKWSCA